MLKTCLPIMGLFIAMALCWALHDPIRAYLEVASLQDPDADPTMLECQLYARGNGAIPALRMGMDSLDAHVKLRCARVLALLGDAAGERLLQRTLREESVKGEALLAEHLLLSVWDLRRSPSADLRRAAFHAAFRKPTDSERRLLDQDMTTNPAWVGGYVLRARWFLRDNELYMARRNAITALLLEPDNFEAAVLLGRTLLLLDYYEHAVLCFEHAIEVHPGLRHRIEDALETARREAANDRQRRREKRAQERPIG